MTESVKELVAIGASVGAHCQPCLEYHIKAAITLGLTEEDIREAVQVGHQVEKGSMAAMKKFTTAVVSDLAGEGQRTARSGQQAETGSEEPPVLRVLKIFDPAMCCSSGVCGPTVDPVLAQFAGTLKFVSSQPGIRVERYNLGQQPRAFVENADVKAMLADGGEQRMPFIFINDQLWIQGRYPSRDELLQELGITSPPAEISVLAPSSEDACCDGKGCC